MLSSETGALARLAGAMRAAASRLLPDVEARRRYFEALVSSETVREGAEAVALLEAHANAEESGVVHLIGAGPGAEDLLTLRAQRLLQAADVIVHDQLVPDAVIEMGRRDAQRIGVGKAKGHHSFTQAQINTLLVRLAREGKQVARLKSGDPMVFGRAGEELAALRKAGIAYQIVPGISAALAAAADTATPVTLRKVSTGVIFATAHGAEDSELDHWAALSGSGLTLALYMGKSIAAETAGKLLARGMSAALPVGIVVNAGRRDRSMHRGTLGALANAEVDMADGPAVILVGDAVAHGDWAGAAAFAQAGYKVA
jgi:uroporphyrin-III C-methyltransferase/precorrin-2 dehydrogenase/sirohydrochlorin ferrochelatase